MKQTICLVMIVKDESPVILRCLASVRPVIDRWLIVDTGSTDGTQEVVRQYMHDLPGEVVSRPWKNFGHNRTEALMLATGRADYLLMIDADEVLECDPGFVVPDLDKDVYRIFEFEPDGSFCYANNQLLRGSLDWTYRGVTHEYLYCDSSRTQGMMRGVRIRSLGGGNRTQDKLRYHRDALLLEEDLIHDPGNPRSVFYLAQSYRDSGEDEAAIRNYRRRAELGGWGEEVWYSLYQIAEIMRRRGDQWPQVMEAYLAAWSARPHRIEPLYCIAIHYARSGAHAVAHLFLSRAMECGTPADDILFIDSRIYAVLLPLEFAVSCYYANDDHTAIKINRSLLGRRDLEPAIREKVQENLEFSLRRRSVI